MKATLTTLALGSLLLSTPAVLATPSANAAGAALTNFNMDKSSKKAGSSSSGPDRAEFRPLGALSVSNKLVRSGSRPQVDWEITYPVSLGNIVDIAPDDSLAILTETHMKIRVAGASYQPYGYDAVVSLKAQISSVGSGWSTLFRGTNGQVDANQHVFSGVVPSGTNINFSVRGQLSSSWWTPSRDTLSENLNITVLRNGDPIPQYAPAFNQGTIESHVSSYVQNGRAVLGPRDLIYLVEVGQTNTLSSGFDMQDMVFIVTFDDVQTPQ